MQQTWCRRGVERLLYESIPRSDHSGLWTFIHSFVLGQSDDRVQVHNTREEGQWLHISQVFLHMIVQPLNEHAHESMAELVFNEAEIGISDLADRKKRRLIVMSMMRTR
jgi:hypothetical protein